MEKVKQTLLFAMTIAFAIVMVFVSSGCDDTDPNPMGYRPIVFVHGMAGLAGSIQLAGLGI